MNIKTTRQLSAVPNLFGYLRILLIPEFVWLYLTDNRLAALAVLAVSGISDVLDGHAARTLGEVTPLGKVLDPAADKLTQLAVLLCLVADYREALFLVIILAASGGGALICGTALIVSGGKPFSSKWYGKLATFSLYAYFAALLVSSPPDGIVLSMTVCVAVFMLGAFALYTHEFLRRIAGLDVGSE